MTKLNKIMDEMYREALAKTNNAQLKTGYATREIDGVEVKLVITPVRTNSKTLNQRTWWVAGKRTGVARIAEAIAAAAPEAEEVLLEQREGESICAMLRRAAAEWDGARKEFIAIAAARGINKATAATQWNQGRK